MAGLVVGIKFHGTVTGQREVRHDDNDAADWVDQDEVDGNGSILGLGRT